jgi:hypothetical protein
VRARRRPRSAGAGTVLLIAVAVLLAGCEQPSSSGTGTGNVVQTGAQTTKSKTAKPGCDNASGKAGAVLPKMNPATYEKAKTNPCIPMTDLVSTVTDLLPEAAGKEPFVRRVSRFAGEVAAIQDAVACGYETDRLAIAIYQQKEYLWSASVVVVVRGRVDELADGFVEGAICYLKKLTGDLFRSEGNRPRPQVCVGVRHPKIGNESYTVLWIGSSNMMCAELLRTVPS